MARKLCLDASDAQVSRGFSCLCMDIYTCIYNVYCPGSITNYWMGNMLNFQIWKIVIWVNNCVLFI